MRCPHFNDVWQSMLLLFVCTCVASAQSASVAQAAPQEHTSEAETAAQKPTVDREQVEDGTPELGVFVAPSPGRRVLVAEVVVGSPAESAGIRPGDYILSVDGEEVSTPGELRKAVRTKELGREVQIVVWRAGEETSKSIVLAKRARQSSTRRAWLGVVLSAAEGDGAPIERVYPRSPAARSGLRRNDIVVGVNGKQIASVDQLIDLIKELEPDSKVKLRVLRGDRELEVTATLEAISAAPGVWRRQAFRPPITQFDWPGATTWLADPLWDRETQLEQMLETLHREVDELREQVKTLKGDSAESNLETDNPGHNENNPDSVQTGRRNAATPRRKYYQDYGRYYRFPTPSLRRSRNLDRLRPPRYYSYYPYAPPPYSYYGHEGRILQDTQRLVLPVRAIQLRSN